MAKTFFLIVILLLIFTQGVSALTANSQNYSISMFGTGLATANMSSTNYQSIFLSEARGTTRNAQSSSYTTNIGFFNNTSPHSTVSITSYSISPSSAVVGSTIGLYISALNYQSVWAKITSPNNQNQTINLVNNEFITYSPPSVVGTYQVIFYANSSTGAIASVVSSFALTAQTTTPSGGGSSGGGGTTTIIEKCTYLWDCTPWSLCADGKQKRACKNTGTCNGTESKPLEEMKCSQSLFDISLKLKNINFTEKGNLKFNIDLTEKIGVEKLDVYIKYSIINKEGYEIFSQIETKAVQENLTYEKEIEEIKLIDGEYVLKVEILYGYQQRAYAEQKIEIANGKIEIIPIERASIFDNIGNILDNTSVMIVVIVVIVVLLSSLFVYNPKNKLKNKRFVVIMFLLSSLFVIIMFLLTSLSILIITTLKSSITPKIIENINTVKINISVWLLVILFLIAGFAILIIKILKNKKNNLWSRDFR